jgi:hypothetical protein
MLSGDSVFLRVSSKYSRLAKSRARDRLASRLCGQFVHRERGVHSAILKLLELRHKSEQEPAQQKNSSCDDKVPSIQALCCCGHNDHFPAASLHDWVFRRTRSSASFAHNILRAVASAGGEIAIVGFGGGALPVGFRTLPFETRVSVTF